MVTVHTLSHREGRKQNYKVILKEVSGVKNLHQSFQFNYLLQQSMLSSPDHNPNYKSLSIIVISIHRIHYGTRNPAEIIK